MSKILELRLFLGLSQGEIANKLGIRRSTYTGYEKLRRRPREYFMETLLNFAKENNFLLTKEDFKK